MKTSVLVLACALVSHAGSAGAVRQITGSEFDRVWDKFDSDRLASATAAEREGDSSLSQSAYEQAYEKYLEALLRLSHNCSLAFGWDDTEAGLKVTKVRPRAESAGLRAGDLITKVDGRDHSTMSSYDTGMMVLNCSPNSEITFTVARDTGEALVKITALRSVMGMDEKSAPVANRLIGKAAAAAAGMKARPPVSADARRLASEAQAAAKEAKDPDELKDARARYKDATILAPAWAELHMNYALFSEASGNPVDALQHFEHFLTLRSDSADADAVRQRIAALRPLAQEEIGLRAWDGWWTWLVNGRPSDTGIKLIRTGKSFHAKDKRGRTYLTATIVDARVAKAVYVLYADSMGSSRMGPLLQRCFGGKFENGQTWEMSADKRRLNVYNDADFDIDPNTCRMSHGRRVLAGVYERD